MAEETGIELRPESSETGLLRQAGLVAVPAPVGLLAGDPVGMIADARRAAAELQRIIATKPRPVIFGGEQYLEFEDWQMLARFCGITVSEDGDPEYVELGEARGFKASAIALDARGRMISRATSYCLSDEERWGFRTKYEWIGGQRIATGVEPVPIFQLASMAQTRANAKALRNVTSWIAVLGGYRPTPAEEMTEVVGEPAGIADRQGRQAEPSPARTEQGSPMSLRWSPRADAFLRKVAEDPNADPRAGRLRAAFDVAHPVIAEIGGKLNRFGSINPKQIKYVLDLADEAGVASYSEESYGTEGGASASSMSATAEPREPSMGATRLRPKAETRRTVAVPDSPPPPGDDDVPF